MAHALSRADVVANGIFTAEENGGIYDKWFARPPAWFLAYALRTYGLDTRRVADVGSAYGHVIARFGPGSYGLELNEHCALFSAAIGLPTYRRDAGADDLTDLPKVEAVWCRDVLEHVDSPHVVLRKLHGLLEDGGRLFVQVPVPSPLRGLRHLPGLRNRFGGYLATDHVNFFTPVTLALTARYAGFAVERMTVGVHWIDPVARALAPDILMVARRVTGWDYPAKATRAADARAGYRYRNPLLHT